MQIESQTLLAAPPTAATATAFEHNYLVPLKILHMSECD